MPQLYVANCTLRTWEFSYRLPERAQVFYRTVPAGQQVPLFPRAETSELVDFVINQHLPYGVFRESDVRNAKCKISGIFGIDKPVSPGSIMLANEITAKMATAEAYEIRKRAAIGSHNALLASLPQGLELGSFQMQVEDRSDKAAPRMVSDFEVAREGMDAPRPKRRKAA